MNQYKKITEKAFALPTLIIAGTILMIVGVSTLQASASISQTFQNQQWGKLASNAAQAGVVYAASCLEASSGVYESWEANPLKPNTLCSGTGNSGAGQYIASASNWRSTFEVRYTPPTSGQPKKVVAIGKVERLNSAGTTVIRAYTSQKKVLLNLPGTPINALGFSDSGQSAIGSLCAIAVGSQAYCTGQNDYGQLGNGNNNTQYTGVKFILPAGLTIRTFTTGERHSCALASDSQVYCAGMNTQGALGNGNTTNQSTPVKFNLPAGLTARSVYLQAGSTCVLASDNQVYCSGANSQGQLGNGNTTNQSTPVKFNLPGALTAKKVDPGGAWYPLHICVLASDNQVYCAGRNDYGQLGRTTSQSTPGKFTLPGSLTAKNVSTGNINTCALASDNQAYCAGYGASGALGDGTTTYAQSTPVKFNLPGALTAKSVETSATAYSSTCVIASNNSLYCAGENNFGQLGDGTTLNRSTAVQFTLPGLAVNAISIGGGRICANVSNGTVYCAGIDENGSLGSGSPNQNHPTPTPFLY